MVLPFRTSVLYLVGHILVILFQHLVKGLSYFVLLDVLEGARASTGLCVDVIYSSVLSFTQFSTTCGRMPLPALWL